MKCKNCNQEIVNTQKHHSLIKIKELGIEITPLIEWTKPYNEIVIPKGFRLAHDWELLWIIRNEKFAKQLFPKIGEDYYYVWCSQVKKDRSQRLYLNWDLNVVSDGEDLASSFGVGRVAFVKEMKK